jgi:hypothetical protein
MIPNVPVEARQTWRTKWNWAGLSQTFDVGIGNRAYLTLLVLIPVVNLIWIFVSGAKVEQWARDNETNVYRDEIEFRQIMDTWNRSGFVQFIILIVILVLYGLFFSAIVGLLLPATN